MLGRSKDGRNAPRTQQDPVGEAAPDTVNASPTEEERIAINGFNQVLEMLKIADPQFRESLLRRLAARDRELARSLREDLANFGL